MRRFCLSTSLVAIMMAGAPAAAQDAAAADDNAGDIVVTAQLREERLQDVPVAISVLSGDRLASQGGVNLETAQLIIPTLNIQRSGTTLNQSLFMRGVGTASFSIAGEPSVSTVVDGVVFSRAGEAFGELVDIERMEILRGPQGTLFGKNASAGVINIVTKRPGDSLGATIDGGFFFENGEEYRLRGSINVPFSQTLRGRFSAFYSNYEGNIFNEAPNVLKRVNGYEHYGLRGMIGADLSDNVTALLIADWRKSDDDCCAQVIGEAVASPAFSALPTPRGDETRRIRQNTVTRTEEESWGASLQIDARLGEHVLTSITAYRDYKNTEVRDGDFLAQPFIRFPQAIDIGPQDSSTFSQELRLASPTGQFLEYLVGAYYSRAKNHRVFTRSQIGCVETAGGAPAVATPCTSPIAGPTFTPVGVADFGSTFNNYAAFANVTLNITDSFRIIGGLRYTHDELSVFHQRVSTGLPPVATPALPYGFIVNPSFGPFRAKTDKDNLSGRAGLQYEFSPESTGYFTYARGYKGPAYNIFFNLNANTSNVIEAETADSFELGLKNSFFGGSLIFNVAAFYAKYYNFQANNPDLLDPTNPASVVTRFTNAGTIRTQGLELDVLYRPSRRLTLSGGLAYTDAQVERFRRPGNATVNQVIPKGTPLLFAPKWKGSLGIDWRGPLSGDYDLLLGAQGSIQSKQLSIFSPDAALRRRGTIDGYGLVNLTAGIASSDDRYNLTFHVRNLFDQSFVTHLEGGGPGGAIRYQIPRDADRYYGITGRVSF
jgi:iron complex outermembrane recepter protein